MGFTFACSANWQLFISRAFQCTLVCLQRGSTVSELSVGCGWISFTFWEDEHGESKQLVGSMHISMYGGVVPQLLAYMTITETYTYQLLKIIPPSLFNVWKRQNDTYSFIICGKWPNLKYLCLAKICEYIPSATDDTPLAAVTSTYILCLLRKQGTVVCICQGKRKTKVCEYKS